MTALVHNSLKLWLAIGAVFSALFAPIGLGATPDYSFLLRLARSKTYVAAAPDRCGLEMWTNTATGLVTLIRKSTDGGDCGAPSVITYQCVDTPALHCRRCLTEQNLCDSLFDETDLFQTCAGGDFLAKGQRFTQFPFDAARATASCQSRP